MNDIYKLNFSSTLVPNNYEYTENVYVAFYKEIYGTIKPEFVKFTYKNSFNVE